MWNWNTIDLDPTDFVNLGFAPRRLSQEGEIPRPRIKQSDERIVKKSLRPTIGSAVRGSFLLYDALFHQEKDIMIYNVPFLELQSSRWTKSSLQGTVRSEESKRSQERMKERKKEGCRPKREPISWRMSPPKEEEELGRCRCWSYCTLKSRWWYKVAKTTLKKSRCEQLQRIWKALFQLLDAQVW